MTRAQLEAEIQRTLVSVNGDFNVPGIADAVLEDHGPLDNLRSLDDVPTDDYWEIVRAYDASDI